MIFMVLVFNFVFVFKVKAGKNILKKLAYLFPTPKFANNLHFELANF